MEAHAQAVADTVEDGPLVGHAAGSVVGAGGRILKGQSPTATTWHRLGQVNHASIGLDVRVLDSPERVQHEAGHMLHCIHTYRTQLELLPRLAFALGDDLGPDRSTLLVGYERSPEGSWQVHVLQHRGLRNRTPTERSSKVAVRLCQRLMSPAFQKEIDTAERARVLRLQFAVLHGELGLHEPGELPVRRLQHINTRKRAVMAALRAIDLTQTLM